MVLSRHDPHRPRPHGLSIGLISLIVRFIRSTWPLVHGCFTLVSRCSIPFSKHGSGSTRLARRSTIRGGGRRAAPRIDPRDPAIDEIDYVAHRQPHAARARLPQSARRSG